MRWARNQEYLSLSGSTATKESAHHQLRRTDEDRHHTPTHVLAIWENKPIWISGYLPEFSMTFTNGDT